MTTTISHAAELAAETQRVLAGVPPMPAPCDWRSHVTVLEATDHERLYGGGLIVRLSGVLEAAIWTMREKGGHNLFGCGPEPRTHIDAESLDAWRSDVARWVTDSTPCPTIEGAIAKRNVCRYLGLDGAAEELHARIAVTARHAAEQTVVAREQEREVQARQRAVQRLRAGGKLGRDAIDAVLASGDLTTGGAHAVSTTADALVECVVRAVGTIGDQAREDLREMRTGEDFSGKRGRNHRLDRTTVERVEHLADWSAALVTLRDYRSFGSSSWGDRYGSRGGSGFRCFLVVRDSSTREAHVLRVPPKFGNASTNFFAKFSGAKARIKAAVAWTFARQPAEYAPGVEA